MTEREPRDCIWRHKKRGTTYRILFETADMQCASAPDFEETFDCPWVVYQNTETAAVYVRPWPEFFDGRFENIGADGESAPQKKD